MKKLILATVILIIFCSSPFAQMPETQIGSNAVFKNEDVIFYQIDEHTWVGTVHLMFNESLFLVEGS